MARGGNAELEDGLEALWKFASEFPHVVLVVGGTTAEQYDLGRVGTCWWKHTWSVATRGGEAHVEERHTW